MISKELNQNNFKEMYILETQNLNKIYANNFKALDSVNFKVKKNSFLALLGKNGAGKTTLLGIINSLIQKTSGKIFVFGKDMDDCSYYIKKNIGIVPQEFNLPVFETPEQVLINQAGYFGIDKKTAKERAKKYLHILDLSSKAHTQVMNLSGGMKRRLMLARALMNEPELLFLDEPSAGVDIEIRAKIWEFLKDLHKSGKTIILTTHYLEEVEELCDHVAFIKNGRLTMNESIAKIKLDNQYLKLETNISSLNIKAINLTDVKIDNDIIIVPILESQSYNKILSEIINHNIEIKHVSSIKNKIENIFYEEEENL
jgi:ABC-2 type transport system ATP-binding protein